MPAGRQTRVITRPPPGTGAERVRRGARWLAAGGICAHASEGVWGLACDPLDRDAAARVLALKRRPAHKGLIVIGAAPSQLGRYVATDADPAWQRALADWPGPTTWLLPARADVPTWLTGGRTTIALRCTAHATAAALCQAFDGALVSTSANPAGRPAPRHGWQARAYFGRRIDAYIGGHCDTPGRPSAIRDFATRTLVRGAADGR